MALYDPKSAQIIVGDILFNGGIGRYDFPKSDGKLLIAGIKAKLLNLPSQTVVYPGHGPTTTIGQEKTSNPFLH
jgi:glyoxylase-like metal-dependent hydrolase (beta-lactamase superfamily II)